MNTIFLQAEWRKLIMANYAVDPALLHGYIPYKTELDLWNNTCYVSLVGFMFKNTRLMGLRIPYHIHFEEVNLRFYVRYKEGLHWKRGVVFIKEIVPRPALAWVANTFYKENYETLPMAHLWIEDAKTLVTEYQWKKSAWNRLRVTTGKESHLIEEGSEAAFITEHYWGYTQRGNCWCSEYGVEHPKWEIYDTMNYAIDVDFANVYGKEWFFLQQIPPMSVFMAEGSEVLIRKGTIIR